MTEAIAVTKSSQVEPLSVAVYACERGKVHQSSSVLIFGAGPVGLMSLAVARTLGAGDVTLVDIDPRRLEIANQMGATSVESAADKTEVSELCFDLLAILTLSR